MSCFSTAPIMENKISFNESWGCIDSLSHAIYQEAENLNWGETTTLAEQRHAKIIDHFKNFPMTNKNIDVYRLILKKLISSEENIIEAINYKKNKLVLESRSLHNQKQGIDAYHASGM